MEFLHGSRFSESDSKKQYYFCSISLSDSLIPGNSGSSIQSAGWVKFCIVSLRYSDLSYDNNKKPIRRNNRRTYLYAFSSSYSDWFGDFGFQYLLGNFSLVII